MDQSRQQGQVCLASYLGFATNLFDRMGNIGRRVNIIYQQRLFLIFNKACHGQCSDLLRNSFEQVLDNSARLTGCPLGRSVRWWHPWLNREASAPSAWMCMWMHAMVALKPEELVSKTVHSFFYNHQTNCTHRELKSTDLALGTN